MLVGCGAGTPPSGRLAFYRIHADHGLGVRHAPKGDSRVRFRQSVADEDIEFIGLR
jgi:hypothetical protein